MKTERRELVVAPDRFEVVSDDVILNADLQSAIAVCIYDAVDESGAMLHLRFIPRGAKPTDVTDTTLATELLLLDRCVEALHVNELLRCRGHDRGRTYPAKEDASGVPGPDPGRFT